MLEKKYIKRGLLITSQNAYNMRDLVPGKDNP